MGPIGPGGRQGQGRKGSRMLAEFLLQCLEGWPHHSFRRAGVKWRNSVWGHVEFEVPVPIQGEMLSRQLGTQIWS